jgi:hypothetical protein
VRVSGARHSLSGFLLSLARELESHAAGMRSAGALRALYGRAVGYAARRVRVRFRGLPSYALRGARSALCVLGGADRGESDLVQLADRGVAEVTVVEPLARELHDLRARYPAHWKYVCASPAQYCRQLLESGARFDVVVCGGNRRAVTPVWEDLVPLAVALARRFAVLGLTGDWAAEQGIAPDRAGVRAAVARLHGLDGLDVVSVVKRGGDSGGAYWAVARAAAAPVHGEAPRGTAEGTRQDDERWCAPVHDLLGAHGCPALDQPCRSTIAAFRGIVAEKEFRPVFRAYTTERFRRAPRARIESLQETAAVLDLERFASMDAVWAAARTATSKRGTVNRKVSRAKKLGYFAERFNRRNFVADIHAVNTSAQLRGGKPMRPNFQRSVDELGGHAASLLALPQPACPVHNQVWWGVFLREPGHRQGELVVDQRLVGYIRLARYGDHAWYAIILGHEAHLEFGIMYLLHYAIVEHYLAGDRAGLRYLCYSGMNSRGAEGTLYKWKKRCLFEPRYLIYDDAGDWRAGS